MAHKQYDHAAAMSRRSPLAGPMWARSAVAPMKPLAPAMPFLAGACAGALVAGLLALLLDTSVTGGVETATVVASLVNCAATGNLVARCVPR